MRQILVVAIITTYSFLLSRSERYGDTKGVHQPTTPPFLGAKHFFHVKLENMKFLQVKNMRDYRVFIEQATKCR